MVQHLPNSRLIGGSLKMCSNCREPVNKTSSEEKENKDENKS
ncbi:MAG: hypothetical protein ACRD9Q_03145 [Nitrososphaeraceae archaeon]